MNVKQHLLQWKCMFDIAALAHGMHYALYRNLHTSASTVNYALYLYKLQCDRISFGFWRCMVSVWKAWSTNRTEEAVTSNANIRILGNATVWAICHPQLMVADVRGMAGWWVWGAASWTHKSEVLHGWLNSWTTICPFQGIPHIYKEYSTARNQGNIISKSQCL